MQIVINISDYKYEKIKEDAEKFRSKEIVVPYLYNVIESGTPLPEGHGDLIDRSKIYKAIPAEEDNCTGMGMTLEEMDAYNEGIDAMYSLIKGAPTIIEADKAESGDKK